MADFDEMLATRELALLEVIGRAITAAEGAEQTIADGEAIRDIADIVAETVRRGPDADDALRAKDGNGFVFFNVTPTELDHIVIRAIRQLIAEQGSIYDIASGSKLRLLDAQRRIFLDITPERLRHVEIDQILSRIAAQAGAFAAGVSNDRLRLADAAKRIFLEVTPERLRHVEIDGLKAADQANASALAAAQSKITRLQRAGASNPAQAVYMLRAQLAHIILYGQSLSLGVAGRPALSTTASLPWAKMFQGGLRSRDAQASSAAYNPDFYASLVALKEADTTTNDGYGETGAYACAEMIAQLLLAEDGIDVGASGQQLLFSAPGEGSQPISTLQSGGTYWPRVQADVTNGAARGLAAGLPYLPHGVTWRQGERDTLNQTAPAAYKAALRDQVVGALRAYAASVTGVDQLMPCVTYQLASHRSYSADPLIALALLELVEEEANFALSAPLYSMPHADHAHLTNVGYRKLGGYEGIAWKRWLFDGVKPRHLRALEPSWLNGAVIVPFDVPAGRLVLDTTAVTNPGNYGFSIVDNAGAAVAISSVSLVGTDRVLIKHAGGALPSGSQLRYAWGTGLTGVGPTAGPRGNLRDNQGDSITFKGSRMDNWAPIFRKTKG